MNLIAFLHHDSSTIDHIYLFTQIMQHQFPLNYSWLPTQFHPFVKHNTWVCSNHLIFTCSGHHFLNWVHIHDEISFTISLEKVNDWIPESEDLEHIELYDKRKCHQFWEYHDSGYPLTNPVILAYMHDLVSVREIKITYHFTWFDLIPWFSFSFLF